MITLPVTLLIDERSILRNQLDKIHWSKKPKMRRLLAWQMRAAMPRFLVGQQPINQFELHVDRYARHITGQLPDEDGIIGGLKYHIDTLCMESVSNPYGLGIVVDDSPKHMLKLTVKPHIVKKQRQEKTVFRITPVIKK